MKGIGQWLVGDPVGEDLRFFYPPVCTEPADRDETSRSPEKKKKNPSTYQQSQNQHDDGTCSSVDFR